MGNLLTLQCLPRKVEKNFAKNLNTFFGVCQNIRISSYVENIFTETPNEKFDVSVNIFSTYEEMEPIRFGSRTSKFLEKKRFYYKQKLNFFVLLSMPKNPRIHCN